MPRIIPLCAAALGIAASASAADVGPKGGDTTKGSNVFPPHAPAGIAWDDVSIAPPDVGPKGGETARWNHRFPTLSGRLVAVAPQAPAGPLGPKGGETQKYPPSSDASTGRPALGSASVGPSAPTPAGS